MLPFYLIFVRSFKFIKKRGMKNCLYHRLYSIYLKNNKDATLQKMNELAILNEVYYQCTFIHNSEEPIDKAYVEKWQKDLTKAVGSKDAADFVACLVMGVFEAMSRHSLTERNFKKWMKMLKTIFENLIL